MTTMKINLHNFIPGTEGIKILENESCFNQQFHNHLLYSQYYIHGWKLNGNGDMKGVEDSYFNVGKFIR